MSHKRRNLIFAGASILLILASLILVWPGPIVRLLASANPDVIFYFATDRPLVGLTLDDGPHPETTVAILDLLAKHGATATFFLIGDRVPGNEELLRRMVAEGHEVGNHGMRDEPAIRLSPEEFVASVDSTNAGLALIARPRWFRPGSGLFNRRMVEVARKRGLKVVLGSVYPFDSTIKSPSFASWFILRNAQPGSIIVLHDHGENGERTLEILRSVIPELRRQGIDVVNLSQLASGSASTEVCARSGRRVSSLVIMGRIGYHRTCSTGSAHLPPRFCLLSIR